MHLQFELLLREKADLHGFHHMKTYNCPMTPCEALTLVVLFAVPRTGTGGVGAKGKNEILPPKRSQAGAGTNSRLPIQRRPYF